ncbi:alpha/beta hydrolase [Magnetococcus sp. PR-3]|uniref:alpha/beta hydrolase n=1 Tax=Magnetococcus sp. PR-3 TaxID=3120355 RepID=UPI002FCE3EBA
MMQVLFSHGKESGPWGGKIKRLASVAEQLGWGVDSIDYRDLLDPDDRVQRLVEHGLKYAEPLVLCGSSMGGYASVCASQQVKPAGVFLLAPALSLPGYQHPSPALVCEQRCIVHGWTDDVVPVEHVIRYAQADNIPLMLMPDGHRLLDSMDLIAQLFRDFLTRIVPPQA